MVKHKEKPKHIEAFELYYLMGDNRSLEKLYNAHPDIMPKVVTLKLWSSHFNWQKRIEQRDIENTQALRKKLEKQTNKTIVNSKADYRAEIKTQLGILKAILNRSIKNIRAGNVIDLATMQDLQGLISSYEKLAKLDLVMMGEVEDREFIVQFKEIDDSRNNK